MELFRLLGTDYAELNTEELQGLLSEWRGVIARLTERDPELVEGLSDEQLLSVVEQGTAAVLEVQGIVTERTEAAEQTNTRLRELAGEAGAITDEADGEREGEPPPPNEDEDGEGDGEDDAADDGEQPAEGEPAEAEALAAAGARQRGVPAHVNRRNQPDPEPGDAQRRGLPVDMRILANVPGIAMGQQVRGMGDLVTAFQDTFHNVQGTMADGQKVPIARARVDFPDERRLDPRNDAGRNTAVIDRFRRQPQEALVAAGGFCAPFTPIYDLLNIAIADEPVADSLMNLNAPRGGITFARPMGLADFDPLATGIITAAEDKAGGSTAVKTKGYVTCPDFTTAVVDAVYSRVGFHNLSARAWPEQVQNALELAAAQHARVSEVHLLDEMVSLADHVTAAAVVGAVPDLLTHIIRQAVVYRSAQRMSPNEPFQVWMPAWVPDLLLVDILRSNFYRFDFDRDSIAAELRKANIAVNWYLDTPTGLNQTYAKQSAGATETFKSTIEWFMAPRNTVGLLSAGSLDFGLVRDSTLNEVNEYEIFSEEFEALYFVGHQLLRVTSTLCANGKTGGQAIDAACA